jgi:hypothetical protein
LQSYWSKRAADCESALARKALEEEAVAEELAWAVRILSPDFLPEYTVVFVLYSTTSLGIKGVEVKSIRLK